MKLCIECNILKGYYPLNLSQSNNFLYSSKYEKYMDCVNNFTKPYNFYFDKENQDYKACYETCATCIYKGDGNENNCTSCEENYIKKPEYENSTNCVFECIYYYYYTTYDQYKCTSIPECPKEYKLLIKNKNKCINNCIDDDKYKFKYNGECLEECPNNTEDNNDYLCKDINLNKCVLSENKYNSLNKEITDEEIELAAEKYTQEFQYTDNHVSVFKNDIYTITFYKNGECISDLSLQIPEIDFGECYQKIQNNCGTEEKLVIAIIDKKEGEDNYHKMISFSMFDPEKGEKILVDDLCKNDKMVMQQSIMNKLNDTKIKINSLLYLTGQNIDIFNLSSDFYTDICYHYNSDLEKDVALRDRILIYFPNITLCEKGCETIGVNLTTLKAICECKFYNPIENNILGNSILYYSQIGEIEEFISNTNIDVIKCFKDIFKFQYFISCTGGFFILGLIFIQIAFTIIYFYNSLFYIKKYIFGVTNKFLINLSNPNNNAISNKSMTLIINNIFSKKNAPPKSNDKAEKKSNCNEIKEKKNKKRHKYKGKTSFHKQKYFSINLKENSPNNNFNSNISNNNNMEDNKYIKDNIRSSKTNNILILSNNSINSIKKTQKCKKKKKRNTCKSKYNKQKKISFDSSGNLNNDSTKKYKLSDDKILQSGLFVNLKDGLDINIKEYLNTDIDDMDYDDAIKKDDRKFCIYFTDKLKTNQVIMNTFCFIEPIKPRPIKIILFILQIDLYFFINGLFFNEEYVSQVFQLKEDTFFDCFERFTGNCFYAALVGVIVNYIIECFFIEEKKIKGILKREKENLFILKYEIVQIMKNIKKRYIFFIMISFIITIFTWYHISCFNIVYPHMKREWFIFSLFIIIVMQIVSFLVCLLESILRFISFKCKSEKIYKISLLLS